MPDLRLRIILIAVLIPGGAFAQSSVPSSDIQIAGAVSPLPAGMRDGATVLGYDAAGTLVSFRDGTNDLICIADKPGDDRFHAACYAHSLADFMQRGRELAAEGKDRATSQTIRMQEIEAGSLHMPKGPAALYQLFGQADSFDLTTGLVTNVQPLYVLYIPYATPESTGLATEAPLPGAPWLMDAGLPWAHIMYSPPQLNP